MLATLVHVFVVLLIRTGAHVFYPLLMLKIPGNRCTNTILIRRFGLPAKFALNFGRLNTIATIVTFSVGNIADKVFVYSSIARNIMELLNNGFYNVDVCCLLYTSDAADDIALV